MRFRPSLGVVVAVVALSGASAAAGAAPSVILASGASLEEPIALRGWSDNLLLLQSVFDRPRAQAADLEGRPHVELVLFWGERWVGVSTAVLRAEALRQGAPGRFYPATQSEPAAIQFPLAEHPDPVLASQEALDILRAHGVPIRLPEDGRSWPVAAIAGAGVLAAIGAAVIFAFRYWRPGRRTSGKRSSGSIGPNSSWTTRRRAP